MQQNTRFTGFKFSELLRENQQRGKNTTHSPHPEFDYISWDVRDVTIKNA